MTDTDSELDVELLANLVAQVVREPGNPFPPPDDFSWWSDHAVWAKTQDIYQKKRKSFVAESRAVAGASQGHLERRLLRSIRNFLIDEAKTMPVGLMRSRLKTMLEQDPGVVRVEPPVS